MSMGTLTPRAMRRLGGTTTSSRGHRIPLAVPLLCLVVILQLFILVTRRSPDGQALSSIIAQLGDSDAEQLTMSLPTTTDRDNPSNSIRFSQPKQSKTLEPENQVYTTEKLVVEASPASYQENVTTASATKKKNTPKKTHWCVLQSRYLPYKPRAIITTNLGHGMEFILPCWSWFLQEDATDNCGIVLTQGLKFGAYQRDLIQGMNCQLVELEMETDIGPPTELSRAPFGRDNGTYYTPNLILLRPRFGMYRYLNHPEDAHALRRQFVSDDVVRSYRKRNWGIQIGILQRAMNRVIVNAPDIQAKLQSYFPSGNVTIHWMENRTIYEQAEWFATKDVIIGAHGAGLSNAIFCMPKTLVLQIYPTNYFFQALEPLIEQSGSIALDWYNGSDPHLDWVMAKRDNAQMQTEYRNVATLHPPTQEIVDKILAALGKTDWLRERRMGRWPSESRTYCCSCHRYPSTVCKSMG